jgi:predicted dehydrogenase
MPDPVQAVLIGAGQRGAEAYGPYALAYPDRLRFVAVAEPDPGRRARFAGEHDIPPDRQFPSWEPLLAHPPLGQAALICTQDQAHLHPTLAALQAGYHVLVEKPMATTPEACRQMVASAEAADRGLGVCHVLRYTPHFQKMREIIEAGVLGQIVNVDHRENVSFWHMAHSYVRGHWAVEAESSPMILAKCCHDFDLLLWLLGRRPLRLSSFGARTHFRLENAPSGAPERCLDGCPVAETCPYYAPFVYVDLLPIWRGVAARGSGAVALAAELQLRAPSLVRTLGALIPALKDVSDYRAWPRSVVALDPTPEKLVTALREGPYGRCVFLGENDVVDHQVVTMTFEGDLTVTLTMHGHAHFEERTTRIDGSRGTLEARFGMAGGWIEVREHRSGRKSRFETGGDPRQGHGGGDFGLLTAFVEGLRPGREAVTSGREALESHLMAFAAERARREGRVVALSEFDPPEA